MYEGSKIFKHFIYFTNLLLDILDGLLSFLNYSFIENNFIVQLQHLLSSE